ncbi:MAG: hypothetical protein P4K98_13980 [Bryobacteraceae bacterium]|nr:hypothetical protein [Bryobacteraceae bacterium]
MISRITYLALFAAVAVAQAQPTSAPSPLHPGSEWGSDWGLYNVTNSAEIGYRFNEVGGDSGLYQSNVNYGNGLRLLGSNFAAHSKDGHGPFFDTLTVATQGLGNDPYSMASMFLDKNGLYSYDMTWRRSDYVNTSLLTGASTNLDNTQRTLQDHNLTITPRKWLKVRLGYARNSNTGPIDAFYELYIGGLARSRLPILRDVRQDFNEYRAGVDIDFLGFRLSLTQHADFYKEDTPVVSLLPGQSYPLPNTSVATSYVRSEPMHIGTLGWFGNLSRSGRIWSMNAHTTYSKSDQTSQYFEAATGNAGSGPSNINISPVIANVSTTMNGAARRPYVTGDLNLSLFPTKKLSIVNNVTADNNRYDATEQTVQLNTTAATQNIFYYSLLGTGRVNDTFDVDYRFTDWLAARAGYQYSDRWVDYAFDRSGTRVSTLVANQNGHLNAGTLGFRLRPLKPVTLQVDAALGKDNAPYTPTSAALYHTIRARADYRRRATRYSATYRQLYNTNAPVAFSYNTSHSRDFTASASFAVHGPLWLDVSYNKLHFDTFNAIFAELLVNNKITNVRGYDSEYISNIHTVSAAARTTIGKRATLYLGYNLTRDNGDGRALQQPGLTDPAAAYLATMQTSPMRYQAPMARVSIQMTPKLQWNAGWEFYRYNQTFALFAYQPYYRAQTGYSSLSFSF